jgi:hypothetical protein
VESDENCRRSVGITRDRPKIRGGARDQVQKRRCRDAMGTGRDEERSTSWSRSNIARTSRRAVDASENGGSRLTARESISIHGRWILKN